ncbi:MAG: hypothetical protein U0802_11200 [Candidatus Binatia bacterium]
MEALSPLIDALRANPLVGAAIAVAIAVAYAVLQRKPRMQREADERLSALRRDKSDQYTKQRPLR